MPHEPTVDGQDDETSSVAGEPRSLLNAPRTIVAHQVRTPLTVIRGEAQLLARIVQRLDLSEPERVRLLHGLARIDTSVSELLASLEQSSAPRTPQEQEPSSKEMR